MQSLSNFKLEKWFFIVINIIIIIVVIFWISRSMLLNNNNCRRLEKNYKNFATIGSIIYENDNYKGRHLRDYYVKSAYNCCAAGKYKNDYVNLCALDACIKQGVRFLDFEIYSIDNKPVIAVSSEENYNIKQSFNSLSLNSVLSKINLTAFSSGKCPNYNDPLILHFRIMSGIKDIYDMIASELENTVGNRLLGHKYSYSSHNTNFGKTPISELKGKIIIIIDNKNTIYREANSSLEEYTNVSSNNSKIMKSMRFFDIKNTHEPDTLLFNNKEYMSVCLPNLSDEPSNYRPSIPINYGCQFIAMSFQKLDTNLKAYNKFFDEHNSAFVLKPEDLRYIPRNITIKDDPSPSLSFGDKKTAYEWIDGVDRELTV